MKTKKNQKSAHKRKVAMVVMAEYPDDSRVRREAEALTKVDYEVDIICQKLPQELSEEKTGDITIYRVYPTVVKESFIDYFRLTLKFGYQAYRKLNALDKVKNYDLIVIHNMPDYLIFSAIKQWRRKPIVLDLHDLTPELFASKWGARKLKYAIPFVKLIESVCCKMASSLLTTSVGFENNLQKRGISKDRMTLILNSADEAFFYYDPNRKFEQIKSGVSLFYHGTVAERFGIKEAIQAIHLIKNKIPNPVFNIYGWYDPSYKLELINIIEELDLSSNVFLNGFMPLEDVRENIMNSDFGVVNYLEDDFMNLALSTKGFEYFSVGIPVIASRLDSIKALFSEESVGYINPGSVQEFADKVVFLSNNPDIREEIVKNALLENEEVSWQKMADRFVQLIDELIDNYEKKGANKDLLNYEYLEDVSPTA